MPRLASEHDGEVIATSRAIGRLLHNAGLDWHDLVEQLHGEAPSPLLEMAEALSDIDALNNWERKFTRDMVRLLRAGAALSPKQEQALRRAFAKHSGDTK